MLISSISKSLYHLKVHMKCPNVMLDAFQREQRSILNIPVAFFSEDRDEIEREDKEITVYEDSISVCTI